MWTDKNRAILRAAWSHKKGHVLAYLTVSGFGLTEKQQAFVKAYVETADGKLSVELAGYATSDNAAVIAAHNFAVPSVMAAIAHETRRKMAALAPIAVNVLRDIATDPTAPKGVRVDAAKALLDRAGFVAPRGNGDQAPERDVSTMSRDELRRFVEAGEAELARRAKDVSAPNMPAPNLHLSDLLD